ncbi:basic leucine zipper 61 [Prunus yedoensis var. nudiflora]|uniref:Basic leucine zipper 61 n=1 Tax=Prunus yedoensis var. nudiflora TaxID=2094558 RepID=A0A314Y8E7_PRUYE|nr:basic leucine zipper 61 [Prunus yedoensis var. nudiflora]
MTPSWPDFSHQKMPPMGHFAPNGNAAAVNATTASQNPCWVDEFLDFSSARRGSHRRSVSDSITFLEAPMQDECRAPHGSHPNNHEFDRFDDEQFMSIINEDEKEAEAPHHKQLKNESEEVESQCEQTNPNNATKSTSNDRKIDPKRVKRILANRQSAQRSRVRKLQYISELERSVTSLQAEVSVLSPRVAFLDHQRLLLNVDNSALKQRIAALAQDKIFKDAHQEALKREIERLRQVYHQQNLKKMENVVQSPTTPSDTITPPEKEQLLNVSS